MLRLLQCPFGLLRAYGGAAAAACLIVLFSLAAARAHEGHDHGDAARAPVTSAYPRIAVQSELYELVGILKNDSLTIYLDHVASNEPVVDASLTVAIGERAAVEAKPTQEHAHTIPFPALPAGASVDVVFTINAKSGDDLLVGTFASTSSSVTAVSPGRTAGPPSWLASIPPPLRSPVALALITFGLGALIGQFWRSGKLAPAGAAGGAAALAVIVWVVAALSDDDHAYTGSKPADNAEAKSDAPRLVSDGTAFVAKPTQRLLEVRTAPARNERVTPAINLIGRVIGDPNRTSVVQSIQGGRVVAVEKGLPTIGQSVRRGDALVEIDPYLPLADRTTISEKASEIDQLIAVAEARIRRLRPLAERGVSPQSQVIDLETELEGLRVRREAIRNTRIEREVLRAPTDGVIAAAKVIPGQVVQPQDVLFQIVDPGGLWVEALAYGELDPTSLVEVSAVATSGQTMPLAFRGFSRALQQHALLVRFAVPAPPANLALGQPVTVVAKSGTPQDGIVVSREAVVRTTNGQSIVWLHVQPERFEPRAVRTQPFDASRVIVAAVVGDSERVVFRGANLINQIR